MTNNLILAGIAIAVIGIIISIWGSIYFIKKSIAISKKHSAVFHGYIIIAEDIYKEFDNSSIDIYNKWRSMNSKIKKSHIPAHIESRGNVFETSGSYCIV